MDHSFRRLPEFGSVVQHGWTPAQAGVTKGALHAPLVTF